MSPRLVAHAVREFGGLTEPFIAQRVAARSGEFETELWYETLSADPPVPAHKVSVRLIRPGGLGAHLFYRLPRVGSLVARPYRTLEESRRPAIIHAHYATTGYLIGSVTKAPLVVSTYGFDVSAMARRCAWRRAFGRLANRAAAVLVEGPHMAGVVEGLGFPADRIRVVRIAANLQDVEYEPQRDLSGPPRLLVCGRLIEKKGHELAIRAFGLLRNELGTDAALEIVGGGPRSADLIALVRRLGLQDRVHMVGPLPRSAYLERLRSATLLLAPSITAANGDSEGGAPTTILDAQASGTIVVGSTHADIPFLVRDGETGILVAEGDVDSLADGIRRALASKPDWSAMAATARAHVIEAHGDAVITAHLGRVYADVLSV
jgi:colanic acid/amylovoran biosynthesis glycosyltransferase